MSKALACLVQKSHFLYSFHLPIFLSILILISASLSIEAQNFVQNPNFTELDSCPYNFGQIRFARFWQTDNAQTPDLYDSCGTSFYQLPLNFGCTTLTPKKDDGFVGIVTFGSLPNDNNIREIMSTSLSGELPMNSDIYCSISVSPMPRCVVDDRPTFLCYTSGIGMAIEYDNTAREIVIEADQIIDNLGEWRTLNGCYEPIGRERRVQIRNFRSDVVTDKDCLFLDENNNISYTFIDNVIVAPFEILPDTLVVCDIEKIQFEAINFYDLGLSWDDDVSGGERTFDQSGRYTLLADADNCTLEESLEVIVISEAELNQQITKCQFEPIELKIDIPGKITWNNQSNEPFIIVNQPGIYSAILETNCDTVDFVFTVTEIECDDVIYVANIFSPNNDNVNDEIQFYLDSKLSINGTLRIFDRWGTLVFQSSKEENMIWDGKSIDGTQMVEGVYVWNFIGSDQSIVQSGSITLIR